MMYIRTRICDNGSCTANSSHTHRIILLLAISKFAVKHNWIENEVWHFNKITSEKIKKMNDGKRVLLRKRKSGSLIGVFKTTDSTVQWLRARFRNGLNRQGNLARKRREKARQTLPKMEFLHSIPSPPLRPIPLLFLLVTTVGWIIPHRLTLSVLRALSPL